MSGLKHKITKSEIFPDIRSAVVELQQQAVLKSEMPQYDGFMVETLRKVNDLAIRRFGLTSSDYDVVCDRVERPEAAWEERAKERDNKAGYHVTFYNINSPEHAASRALIDLLPLEMHELTQTATFSGSKAEIDNVLERILKDPKTPKPRTVGAH